MWCIVGTQLKEDHESVSITDAMVIRRWGFIKEINDLKAQLSRNGQLKILLEFGGLLHKQKIPSEALKRERVTTIERHLGEPSRVHPSGWKRGEPQQYGWRL